jgi:hypothetical protein
MLMTSSLQKTIHLLSPSSLFLGEGHHFNLNGTSPIKSHLGCDYLKDMVPYVLAQESSSKL